MRAGTLRRGAWVLFGMICASCAASPHGGEATPEESDVAVAEAGLCLVGPAFPSCYGGCGSLQCSPIDPGACCACDEGCVDRGDCCCDYPIYCAPSGGVCAPSPGDTCVGHCGRQAEGGCWCDAACSGFGDCCADFVAECRGVDPSRSCEGNCDTRAPGGCFCDTACTGFGDCCDDYEATCACNGSVDPEDADERVAAIAVGPSGEVYVAGTRAPPGGFASDASDGFLRRVDPTSFATLWDRTIDNCFWDSINDLAVLPGGDVVVVGATRSGAFASTPTRLLVRRYDDAGYLMWESTPETSLGQVVGQAVAVVPESGAVVITGAVTSATTMRPLLARLDGLGSPQLIMALSGPRPSAGRGIATDCDGNVAIVTLDSGGPARVIALTASGAVRWSAAGVANSEGVDVAFGALGELYALSTVRSGGGTLGDLSRYSNTGSLVFRHSIDLTSRHFNPVAGLFVTDTGAVAVAGAAASPIGVLEPFVRVVSASGTTVSTRIRSGFAVSAVAGVAKSGSNALLAAQVRPAGSSMTDTVIVSEPL